MNRYGVVLIVTDATTILPRYLHKVLTMSSCGSVGWLGDFCYLKGSGQGHTARCTLIQAPIIDS